jgi:HEAT repeat protein
MLFRIGNLCGCRLPARHRAVIVRGILFVLVGRLTLLPAFADGCFVFRWNKNIDINEPTQKAIIVHDAGREDLLLQVKYEGPLEEFGWLIPVPSLPTVEKGSMQPFYELSQLTQRQWGESHGATPLSAATRGAREDAMNVIEIKTVGAYEVAILSAQDAGSLERWLKVHDYSIPEGKAEIIDEYILKGWYFVAAKIDLSKPVAFTGASKTAPKDTDSPARVRDAIQKKLSTGELHSLHISFDTPKCIYPLRISAVGGKPSEVSLYVLSADALLDKFTFDKGLEKLHQSLAERDRTKQEREKRGRKSLQNQRSLHLAAMMYSLESPGEIPPGVARDWSLEDLAAIGKEDLADTQLQRLDNRSYTTSYEPLDCLQVAPQQIPQCAKDLPRLKGMNWYLTKDVWRFQPEEMHDLEFQPAIPALAAALPDRAGDAAAVILPRLGASGDSALVAACQSTNALQRVNASAGLQALQDPRLIESLLTLLKDDVPEVRFNAVTATESNWDPRFLEPLISLLRDPYPQIRQHAAEWLCLHESTNRAPIYLALLRDPDPDVQTYALRVLLRMGRNTIPRAELLRLLGSPRLGTVSAALGLLQGRKSRGWTYQPPTTDPRLRAPTETNCLTSAEAAPLATNRLTMARLMGLEILRQNADAQAVALTLPLLRDTNSIVRNRASALLRTVSGQDIPQNEPAKWEQWWAANKDTFVAPKPVR